MTRENQKQRTRLALIDAAAVFASDGRSFSVADVAEAAKVSTATAYRYFPNPQSLWAELEVRRSQTADIGEVLQAAGEDPLDRIDALVRFAADMQFGDEASWRGLLRASLERWFEQGAGAGEPRTPVRGDSRMVMTQQALEPLAGKMPPELLQRLTMALMLVYGLEAMIVTRDACQLEQDEATEVMRWAAQALIRAAMAKDS